MKIISKHAIFILDLLLLFVLFVLLIRGGNVQLLNPQGYIAQQQSVLLIMALLVGLLVGVPVVIATLVIVFKYREENTNQAYSPNWMATKGVVAAWWSAPALLVLIWAIIGWQYAHNLDPSVQIHSNVKPITIQVVSLQWKWLFIYPEQRVATVNVIEIPVNTPVNFQLTSDAPMNSFWIPSLGGQIYSMTGMVTQLHLIANHIGEYQGGPAEMSGAGFAGMNFTVNSTSNEGFTNWLSAVRQSGDSLSLATYSKLAQPSSYNSEAFYNYTDQNLFNEIVDKYMTAGTKGV